MTLLVRNNSPSAPKVWLSQDHRQLEVEIIFSTIPTKSKQKPHLHKTWLSADPGNKEDYPKAVLRCLLEEDFCFHKCFQKAPLQVSWVCAHIGLFFLSENRDVRGVDRKA